MPQLTEVTDVQEVHVKNVEMSEQTEKVVKKTKLPFGHFKVTMSSASGYTEVTQKPLVTGEESMIVKPLTQEDYSNGWNQVLPLPKRGRQPVHHWSVPLAQLPPHLWSKLHYEYDEGHKYIPVIKDNIYHYTVTESEHDDTLRKLHTEVYRGMEADRTRVKELVSKLDGMNSWLVTRARKFLNGNLEQNVAF